MRRLKNCSRGAANDASTLLAPEMPPAAANRPSYQENETGDLSFVINHFSFVIFGCAFGATSLSNNCAKRHRR
jgi:hypothetical protein